LEEERIKARKSFDKNSVLFTVDPETLPPAILERQIERTEGDKTYADVNRTIHAMKKYLKQKQSTAEENKLHDTMQAEKRALFLQQVMRSQQEAQRKQNTSAYLMKDFSTDLNGNTIMVRDINANNLK
jgi:hypothetical protein